MPGILGGALLASRCRWTTLSSPFHSGAGFNTLPVRVFGMIKRVTPEINAISTLMLLASFGLIVFSILSRRRSGSDEEAIQFGL